MVNISSRFKKKRSLQTRAKAPVLRTFFVCDKYNEMHMIKIIQKKKFSSHEYFITPKD